jgi:hypothetical protein
MRIYLAGKVSKNCWRHEIIEDLRSVTGGSCMQTEVPEWPILHDAIFGCHDYVGPFFIGCDHGCFHGDTSHGSIDVDAHCDSALERTRRDLVVRRCKNAIRSTDLFFAWITDQSCYGTIAELGYAVALRKRICIATPIQAEDYLGDIWFPFHLAGGVKLANNPREALADYLNCVLDNPRVRNTAFGPCNVDKVLYNGPVSVTRDMPKQVIKSRYPNHGNPWSTDADSFLQESFNAGTTIEDISHALGRTPGSIMARLEKYGLLTSAEHISILNGSKRLVNGGSFQV